MNLKVNIGIKDLVDKFNQENTDTLNGEETHKELLRKQVLLFATWLDTLDIEKIVGRRDNK